MRENIYNPAKAKKLYIFIVNNVDLHVLTLDHILKDDFLHLKYFWFLCFI